MSCKSVLQLRQSEMTQVAARSAEKKVNSEIGHTPTNQTASRGILRLQSKLHGPRSLIGTVFHGYRVSLAPPTQLTACGVILSFLLGPNHEVPGEIRIVRLEEERSSAGNRMNCIIFR